MAYHHGDLRRTMLSATASAIDEEGVAKLSLRALAKRAGVSNAAPTHHFGDKAGLLTALAVEGYDLMADAMSEAGQRLSLVEMGVAYVTSALNNPAHFSVMFQPHMLRADDAELNRAQVRLRTALTEGVAQSVEDAGGESNTDAWLAAWSLVHGYATLVLSGAINEPDPVAHARIVASHFASIAGSS